MLFPAFISWRQRGPCVLSAVLELTLGTRAHEFQHARKLLFGRISERFRLEASFTDDEAISTDVKTSTKVSETLECF